VDVVERVRVVAENVLIKVKILLLGDLSARTTPEREGGVRLDPLPDGLLLGSRLLLLLLRFVFFFNFDSFVFRFLLLRRFLGLLDLNFTRLEKVDGELKELIVLVDSRSSAEVDSSINTYRG
jgi:hypothetical protein